MAGVEEPGHGGIHISHCHELKSLYLATTGRMAGFKDRKTRRNHLHVKL